MVPAQSYVSYPDVSLSMKRSLRRTFLSDVRQLEVDLLDSGTAVTPKFSGESSL